VSGEFQVEIRIEVSNQRGVLATIASTIAEMQANIENVGVDHRDGKYTALLFVLNVRDRGHLASIIRRIKQIDAVAKISRAK
jgi:(p)ppGpp synthase/HD superfamily hydrolase